MQFLFAAFFNGLLGVPPTHVKSLVSVLLAASTPEYWSVDSRVASAGQGSRSLAIRYAMSAVSMAFIRLVVLVCLAESITDWLILKLAAAMVAIIMRTIESSRSVKPEKVRFNNG